VSANHRHQKCDPPGPGIDGEPSAAVVPSRRSAPPTHVPPAAWPSTPIETRARATSPLPWRFCSAGAKVTSARGGDGPAGPDRFEPTSSAVGRPFAVDVHDPICPASPLPFSALAGRPAPHRDIVVRPPTRRWPPVSIDDGPFRACACPERIVNAALRRRGRRSRHAGEERLDGVCDRGSKLGRQFVRRGLSRAGGLGLDNGDGGRRRRFVDEGLRPLLGSSLAVLPSWR